MTKELEYAIIDNSNHDKEMGRVWLEDGKIKANPGYLKWVLKPMRTAGNYSIEDGRDYLENLPTAFRNGYMSCKRVKNDK